MLLLMKSRAAEQTRGGRWQVRRTGTIVAVATRVNEGHTCLVKMPDSMKVGVPYAGRATLCTGLLIAVVTVDRGIGAG